MSSESYSDDEDDDMLVVHVGMMEEALTALERMEKRYAQISIALRLLASQFEYLRKQILDEIEKEKGKDEQD